MVGKDIIFAVANTQGTTDLSHISPKTAKYYKSAIKKGNNKHSIVVHSKENDNLSVSILFLDDAEDVAVVIDSIRSISEYLQSNKIHIHKENFQELSEDAYIVLVDEIKDCDNIVIDKNRN